MKFLAVGPYYFGLLLLEDELTWIDGTPMNKTWLKQGEPIMDQNTKYMMFWASKIQDEDKALKCLCQSYLAN